MYTSVCLHVCKCTTLCLVLTEVRRQCWIPWSWSYKQLWADMCAPGPELKSLARAVSSLSCCPISLHLIYDMCVHSHLWYVSTCEWWGTCGAWRLPLCVFLSNFSFFKQSSLTEHGAHWLSRPMTHRDPPASVSPTLGLKLHQWPSMTSHVLRGQASSTTWVIFTHYKVQLQHKVQPWLSLEHNFFVLSENISQKISPKCCQSLLNQH